MPQRHPPRYKQFEPRRRHPVRQVLLALVVAGGVAGGGAAIVTSIGDEVSGQAPPGASPSPTVRKTPRTVSAGKAFTVGRHQMLAGWTVGEEFGRFTVTGRVRNVSDTNGTVFLQMRFLKGSDLLATVQCASDELEPSQSGALVCVPDGVYSKAYTRITVEASF